MALFTTAIITLLVSWFIVKLYQRIKTIQLLPSGPWGLPIVGYLPFLKRDNYLQFIELSKKYGPVYSMKLGVYDTVVLNDWPSIEKAMANDDLLARPDTPFFPGIIDDMSFAEMSGNKWREHRRVAIHHLRDAGLGRSAMEEMVKDEIHNFIERLDKHKNQAYDIFNLLRASVSNNITLMVFGRRMDYDDPAKIELDQDIDEASRHFQFAGLFLFLPQLAKILVKLGLMNYGEISDRMMKLDQFCDKEIREHEDKTSKQEITDYIDGYLAEKASRQSKNRGGDDFDNDTLRRDCLSFFGAGSETVRVTLMWTLIYMVKYPKVQEKVRSEINSIIGPTRNPSLDDRKLMPYTLATIYEAQRQGSVIPTNLLRRAEKDTRIGNHMIPKDTLVIFNLHTLLTDPKLWDEPEQFRPERFLTENGNKAVRPPYHLPFSGGKRICPGESLAYVELFLYLTSILQRYRVKLAPGQELSTESEFGISRRPKNMPKLVFESLA